MRTCYAMVATFKLVKGAVDTRAPQAYLRHRNIQHTVLFDTKPRL